MQLAGYGLLDTTGQRAKAHFACDAADVYWFSQTDAAQLTSGIKSKLAAHVCRIEQTLRSAALMTSTNVGGGPDDSITAWQGLPIEGSFDLVVPSTPQYWDEYGQPFFTCFLADLQCRCLKFSDRPLTAL
jgi:hypothetical protein